MKKSKEKNGQLSRKYVNILGINIASTNINEVLTGVSRFIAHNRKFSIVTPNPELVVMSQKNTELKEALNNADFAVPDGVGLKYASKFLYGKDLEIIPGRKLFDELIKVAAKKGWKVFLLGGMGEETALTASKLKMVTLRDNNLKLKIETAGGSKVTPNLHKNVIDRINKFAPQLLFVAFGNPKQEIWIQKNLARLNIGGVMAVGGTFRYIAGLSKLPPAWMEEMGLEWLWRVLTEPVRLRRIWNAVVVFPWRVLIFKLCKK